MLEVRKSKNILQQLESAMYYYKGKDERNQMSHQDIESMERIKKMIEDIMRFKTEL